MTVHNCDMKLPNFTHLLYGVVDENKTKKVFSPFSDHPGSAVIKKWSKLVFQFLSVWAEILHDNKTSLQQSYFFGVFDLKGFWREHDVIRLTTKNGFRLMAK